MAARGLKNLKIVCLGGGVGTSNLIKGLKKYTDNITVVVSMADDGGSAGRLRRFYSVPPPGDLINCLAVMSNADPRLVELLTFRFSGNRYGSDRALPGHKLGNLMLVALSSITGDFYKALEEMEKLFKTSGRIFPSTNENISIQALTSVGEEVFGEANIDLGRFTGKIEKVFLKPSRPTTPPEVKKALLSADAIIAGPGDLYTTILPVLLVPDLLKSVKASKAKKFYVVNVANKTFETPGYMLQDYLSAIIRHCRAKVFDYFLVNNNTSFSIPRKWRFQYEANPELGNSDKMGIKVLKHDLVDEDFPLYHDPRKLAKALLEYI